MSKLSASPQRIDDRNWYYEENGGIDLLHQIYDENDVLLKTDVIRIPWKMLRKSLQRKDAK